jgi:chemotaxis protein methyltransferase CheR
MMRTDTRAVHQVQPLSEQTFELFRKLIYEETGIYMRECKKVLVSNRLRKRLLALKHQRYEDYYRYLTESEDWKTELPHFIDAVSTNETYFFRESNHFEALRRVILPQLYRRKSTLRVWSAGCSSGEEAYTLKIVIDEALAALGGGKAEITATDISSRMIEKAVSGEYKQRTLRFVPPDILQRCFIRSPEGVYRVKNDIREGIRFGIHNLVKDTPPEPGFDIICCRNVMIYFTRDTQKRLLDGVFSGAVNPGGYLLIGHSESLSGKSEKFRYLKGLKASVYQKI